MYKPDGHNIAKRNIFITFLQHNAYRAQWRSQGGGGGTGAMAPQTFGGEFSN